VPRSVSRVRATAAAVAAAVVPAAMVLGAAGAGASPAVVATPAATSGPCPEVDQGVTVVVDFGAFGGGVVTRCAPGSPSSGFAALRDAGFAVTPVSSNHGFLCRIDGLPGPEADRCQEIPPSSAYWAYHLAERGGSWQASTRGAGNRTPPPGSVEGWAFGSGAAPSVPPPPPPAPPTTAPTTTTTAAPALAPPPGASGTGAAPSPAEASPAGPTSGAGTGDVDAGAGTPGDERPDPAGETGAQDVVPTEEGAGGSPTERGADEATRRGSEDRASGTLVIADREDPGRGAPVATAAGVGLVATLGAAAAWRARRRAGPDPGDGLP
jgi:hypothetical protein